MNWINIYFENYWPLWVMIFALYLIAIGVAKVYQHKIKLFYEFFRALGGWKLVIFPIPYVAVGFYSMSDLGYVPSEAEFIHTNVLPCLLLLGYFVLVGVAVEATE